MSILKNILSKDPNCRKEAEESYNFTNGLSLTELTSKINELTDLMGQNPGVTRNISWDAWRCLLAYLPTQGITKENLKIIYGLDVKTILHNSFDNSYIIKLTHNI